MTATQDEANLATPTIGGDCSSLSCRSAERLVSDCKPNLKDISPLNLVGQIIK